MDFLNKINQNPYSDLYWNIPEQKQGTINIIGGNSQTFRTPVKVAEFLSTSYPVRDLKIILPDALKNKLPPLDNMFFVPSTNSGSIADSPLLAEALNSADFNLIIGDLSKSSITAKAIESVCKGTTKPTMITRDTVDLIAENITETTLMNENLILFGSMIQFQKIFRAVYYPKVLLLSQSLLQVAEALHKFTLSYPVSLITFHSGQILVAQNGNVNAVPIENSKYSPLTIWSGELAAKIVALNLYNPNNFIKATTAALFT